MFSGKFSSVTDKVSKIDSKEINDDISFIEQKLKGYLPGMIKKIS
jgi:hypothetical protein